MENVSMPYSPLNEIRSLFDNQEQSDVRFLVEGQTVYGHKFMLGMGSPAFHSMFYGDLKESGDEIKIEDLSLVGFKNALRYIYGFQIDFELSELYDSYLAADKYLLHHFKKAFFDYIKDKLNSENCILICEQLVKIRNEEILLAYVRLMIVKSRKSESESERFMQIDQKTLISLLSLDKLNIAEIDLLAVVLKWIDWEVQRQGLVVNCENKRKVFEPIKSYIIFTALTPAQIASCDEIVQLLTAKERGSVLLHKYSEKNPSIVELRTLRRAHYSLASVFVSDSLYVNADYTRSVYLKVNCRVGIQTIYSTYSERAANLSLQIQDSAGATPDLKMNKLAKDGKLSFSFNRPFDLKPDSWYRLSFTGNGLTGGSDQLSEQRVLNFENSTVFNLNFTGFGLSYHCVRGLDFFPSD